MASRPRSLDTTATVTEAPPLPARPDGAVRAPPPPPRGPTLDRRSRRFSFHTFDSLSDVSFRWYFFSMFGWFASMNMQMLVRGVIVFELTGSYAALGLISLANALPGLFLSLPGGLVADRVSKKRTVQIGQLCNMSVSAVLATLMLAGLLKFEHLVACAVLQGMINALIMPARQSMIPEIVDDDRLMNAVALNSAGTNVMRLAAPALGGLLLVVVGPGWVYMTMAGLYAAGALCLVPVRPRQTAATVSARTSGQVQTSMSDLVAGMRYIWQDRTVFIILLANLLIVLVSQPYQQMLPGFAKDVLDVGPGRLGLLMTLTGAGALAGSLAIASMPARNRGRVFLISSLVLGLTMLAFSVSTIYWLTAVIIIGVGIGQSGRMSLGNVLIQSYTAPEYRGRVMSFYMLEFSLVSFGTFFVGIAANIVGPQVAVGATAVALMALAGMLFLLPRMRNLP